MIVLAFYLVVVFFGFASEHQIEKKLSPQIYQNPSLEVKNYLDDFLRVRISCSWENKSINFLVFDDLENIWHNSTSRFSCNGYKEVDLQGSP